MLKKKVESKNKNPEKMKIVDYTNQQSCSFENHLIDIARKYPKAEMEEVYTKEKGEYGVEDLLYVFYTGPLDPKELMKWVKKNGYRLDKDLNDYGDDEKQ